MKRKAFMIIFLMSFIGFLLIGMSFYLLYLGSYTTNQKLISSKNELEVTKKKLEHINNEWTLNKTTDSIQKSTHHVLANLINKNIPIVEITDVDLSREEIPTDENEKKVYKLMYTHQLRFYLFNIGKNSMKDVIFSIKDIYNDPKEIKKKRRVIGHTDAEGKKLNGNEIGTYENFEVNTLPLKTRRLVYSSTLPNSFGVGDYSFHVIVEWNEGFYQMKVTIEEIDGKLKYKYEYFDVKGNPIDFKALESSINN